MKALAFRSNETGVRASALLLVGWLCTLAPGVAAAQPDLLDLREAVVVTSAAEQAMFSR